MNVDIKFYKMSDPVNKINKTLTPQDGVNFKYDGHNLKLTPNRDFSIMNPVFTILNNYGQMDDGTKFKPTDFNYVYLKGYGYYFVKDWVWKTGGLFEMYLELDVLYTHKEQINALNVEVARSETKKNLLLHDEENPLNASRTIKEISFGAFDTSNMKTYLCVSGG